MRNIEAEKTPVDVDQVLKAVEDLVEIDDGTED
jgi:hypothetical protein